MAFNIKKTGTWSDAVAVKLRKASAWEVATFVNARKAGEWVQIWPTIVSITETWVERAAVTGTEAKYIVNTSGIIQKKEGASTSTVETWLLSGAAADYEVRATLTSGDTPTGSALATWLALSTTRDWALTDSTQDGFELTCTLTVEIRLASTGILQDSTTVHITSERLT